jgi:hypothetical protein
VARVISVTGIAVNLVSNAVQYLPARDLPAPTLQALYGYWNGLRGTRRAPARGEVDPVDIPREILPDLLLTEVVSADSGRRYRFRLVGSRVVEQAGRDPSRQFLDEALPTEFGYRDYIVGLYDTIAEMLEPVYSRSSYITFDTGQRPERATHRLMLPLLDDDGALTHVLAAQAFELQHGVMQKPFLAPDEVVYGETRLISPE